MPLESHLSIIIKKPHILAILLSVALLMWQLCEGFEIFSRLQRLVGGGIDFGAEVRSSCASSRKVAGEHWLDDGAKNNFGATGDWECEPKSKNELEGVVEWEPVNGVNSTLKHSQESENDPICEPLSVIGLANAE